jgi:hypothetical protein
MYGFAARSCALTRVTITLVTILRPPDPASIALATAVQRRLPRLLDQARRGEPLLSRTRTVTTARGPVRVSVDLGAGAVSQATYDLAFLCSGVSTPAEFAASLENDAYFDVVANRIARVIADDQSGRTEDAWYAEERCPGFLGLTAYAPTDPTDDWIGGLAPDTDGWSPRVAGVVTNDPRSVAQALIELSLDCTHDLTEPTLIAAGRRLAAQVRRGFQVQQRFYSVRGGVHYMHVGAAEMFCAPAADPNAAFVLHPDDFALHHTPPLVTVSGGSLLARVDQQLVCTRRYLLGRLQRYDGLQY